MVVYSQQLIFAEVIMFSWLLFSSTLYAQDPLLMISPVRATETSQMAGMRLINLLEYQIQKDGYSIAIVDEYITSVNEQDKALDYLDSCMMADGEGYRVCVQQIAEANQWDYAISVEIKPLETGYRVKAWIIDVFGDQQISTPELDIQQSGYKQWATIVSLTYQNVVKNGIQSSDMRQEDMSQTDFLNFMEDQLKDAKVDELPDIDMAESVRENLTEEDITRLAEEDVPPWEEIGLNGTQYLDFYNTQNKIPGFTLSKWKKRMNGKFGYLSLGLSGGFSVLPSQGSYYAYRLRSSDLIATLETYAEQTLQNSGTRTLEISAGIGILPQVELTGFFGSGVNKYMVDLYWITIDNNQPSHLDEEVPQSMIYYGGRVDFSLPSLSNFRPMLGLSASYWLGNSGHDYFGQPELQEEFPDLGAPSILVLGVEPGVEVRMGKMLDGWIRIPVTYSMVNNAPARMQSVDELQYEIPEGHLSEGFSPLGFGAMLGMKLYIPVFTPSFTDR
jgi:hypothetical protein